jgi:hypothetical protein
MVKFVVKEREDNEACFVTDEDEGLIFAKAFAAYLNNNIR